MKKLILINKKDTDYGDGWVAKQTIHEDARRTEYYYEGRRIKRNVVTGRIAEQYAGYALIEKDLRTILRWLEKTDNFLSEVHPIGSVVIKNEEEWDSDIVKALFVAIVSFYGRLFNSCEGRGGVKLGKEIIPKEFLSIHDELMGYRNKFVSHAGVSNAELVEIVCARPSENSIIGFPRIFIELRQLDTIYPRDDEKTIRKLVLELQKRVKEKMMKFHDKIHQEQIFGKSQERKKNP